MPEPFKNVFNGTLICRMAEHLSREDPGFREGQFVAAAGRDLEKLELKERSNQILAALEAAFPGGFRSACETMLGALYPEEGAALSDLQPDHLGIRGWGVMPMADFVAKHGLDDFDFSMGVLREMTKRFTAEFAVRAFLNEDPVRALRHVAEWAKDPSVHVRRLASEGTRPRLPWGKRLPVFIADPSPLLPLLEVLGGDPEEYVRRSVANNLNDISKDHPDLVAGIARRWSSRSETGEEMRKLIRHACRTLVKKGHRPTLDALGYRRPQICVSGFAIKNPRVELGGVVEFGVTVASTAKKSQPLVVDYVVHHRKANGTLSPKVFKWKTFDLPAGGECSIVRRHAIRPVTTRVYYGGAHGLELLINGESSGRVGFELVLP